MFTGLIFKEMEIRFYDGNKCKILCIMSFSDAVMEIGAGQQIGWVDPKRFAEMFLAGRAKSTFPTYDLVFRKLWFHGLEIGKSVFWWTPMDMAG